MLDRLLKELSSFRRNKLSISKGQKHKLRLNKLFTNQCAVSLRKRFTCMGRKTQDSFSS